MLLKYPFKRSTYYVLRFISQFSHRLTFSQLQNGLSIMDVFMSIISWNKTLISFLFKLEIIPIWRILLKCLCWNNAVYFIWVWCLFNYLPICSIVYKHAECCFALHLFYESDLCVVHVKTIYISINDISLWQLQLKYTFGNCWIEYSKLQLRIKLLRNFAFDLYYNP